MLLGRVLTIVAFLVFANLDECRLTMGKVSIISTAGDEKPELTRLSRNATLKKLPKPVVQHYTVYTDVKYHFAKTVISCEVANPADGGQDVTFSAIKPKSAFFTEFVAIVKDEIYKTRAREKNEAKTEYNRAQEAGLNVQIHDKDDNRFGISFYLEAKSSAKFNITYEEVIRRKFGIYEYQINLNPRQVVNTLDVIVNIEESVPLTSLTLSYANFYRKIDFQTPKSTTTYGPPANRTATIRWSPTRSEQESVSKIGMEGLILIRYDINKRTKSNQILVEKSYFVHYISPANLQILAKHVVFVLDIGATISGLEWAKKATEFMLTELGSADYFSLVVFSEHILLWSTNGITKIAADSVTLGSSSGDSEFIMEASEKNVYDAVDFINNLELQSGSNIFGALRAAVNLTKIGKEIFSEHQPFVILLAHGKSINEGTNLKIMYDEINDLNSNLKCTIFALVLDSYESDGSFMFFDALAKRNGGYAQAIDIYVEDTSRIYDFYKVMSSPLMSDISIKYDPKLVNESSITSTNFYNYFDGTELLIAGRLSDRNRRRRKLEARFEANYKPLPKYDSKVEKIIIDGKASFSSSEIGVLERLWAFLRVKQLSDLDLINEDRNSSLKNEILSLCLKYSFVIPSLTSLLFVQPNKTAYSRFQSIGKKNERIGQPSEGVIQLFTEVFQQPAEDAIKTDHSLTPTTKIISDTRISLEPSKDAILTDTSTVRVQSEPSSSLPDITILTQSPQRQENAIKILNDHRQEFPDETTRIPIEHSPQRQENTIAILNDHRQELPEETTAILTPKQSASMGNTLENYSSRKPSSTDPMKNEFPPPIVFLPLVNGICWNFYQL